METADLGQPRRAIGPCPVRYIKLGSGGGWEASALEGGRLEWGNSGDPAELAFQGDWDGARRHYLARGLHAGTATGYANELREFFTLGADTLWITFARDRLWWAFTDPEVVYRGADTPTEGSFYRRTLGPWRCTDVTGKPLVRHDLSTALTQVAGYRRTMCRVAAEDYLFRVLNGEQDQAVLAAQTASASLADSFAALIRQLHWADFELLVDLIFARAGWRRTSRLGGTLKDHDLILEQPITGEKISVQVKSKASQQVLDRYVETFITNGYADRLFFICHGEAVLKLPDPDAPVKIWNNAMIARQTVAAGLGDWLVARAA